jgi:hypothetical protein
VSEVQLKINQEQTHRQGGNSDQIRAPSNPET